MTNNVEELIVLGNGFDLQCGLQTGYWNFFSYTLRNLDEFQEHKDDENKDPIEYFEKNIQDFFYYGTFGRTGINAINIKFKDIPKNLWYQIFLCEKVNRNSQWNQIENIIFDYMYNKKIIEKILEVVKKMPLNKFYTFTEVINNYNMTTDEEIVVQIIYSLVIDKAGNKISSLAMKLRNDENREENEIKFREYVFEILYRDLKEIERDFIQFILNQIEYSPTYINNVHKLLGRILYGYVYFGENKYNVLTFNYTHPFSEIKHKPTNILNVHGVIFGNSKNNEVIFGIDHKISDEKTIPTNSLAYRFTKNYRTLQLYSINPGYENYQNVYSDSIKKIKFYGHSLAEADYSYFQQMFDYYDLYSNNDLQLIFYYSVYDERKEEEIRQSQFNSISKLISTYGATLDNKDKGNNLLTRLMQTGRLRLKQI